MRKSYRPAWPLLVALALGVTGLIAIAGLAPDGDSDGEAVEETVQAYIEGVAGSPSRVNPLFVSSNDVDSDLSSLVFSGLVRLGANGEAQPDLAESWSVSDDGLTYEFALRSGLTWQDGDTLDAADVLFTIETIQDPEFDGDASLAEVFAGVEAEAGADGASVIVTLPGRFAPFLALGATVGVLPSHLFAGLDAPQIGASPLSQRPIGSGPFKLVNLTPSEAVLEANPDYHFGRPALEELELRFFRDEASLLTALREDEVDGALFRPGISREDAESLADDSRWSTRTLHSTSYSLVYLNPQIEALQDPLVRKALQHATDRATVIEAALSGQAVPVNSPIPLDLWASTQNEEAYRFDQATADALLVEAGWTLEEGVRTKDGEALALSLVTSDDAIQTLVAQEIASQWGALGVEVTVSASGVSQFIEDVLLPRAFDAALVTIEPGPDPDAYPFWHSSQALGEGRNLSAFSDPFSDRLLEEARQSTSIEERLTAYGAFEEIFAVQQPAVLLDTPAYHYALPADMEGAATGVLFRLSSRFYDVPEWRLVTSR